MEIKEKLWKEYKEFIDDWNLDPLGKFNFEVKIKGENQLWAMMNAVASVLTQVISPDPIDIEVFVGGSAIEEIWEYKAFITYEQTDPPTVIFRQTFEVPIEFQSEEECKETLESIYNKAKNNLQKINKR